MLKKYGISLVTLVIAITILSVISTITIISVNDVISEADLKTFALEIYDLQMLVDKYKIKNNGKLDFTTYTVNATDITGDLKTILTEEDSPGKSTITFYLLDEEALNKLGVEDIAYGKGTAQRDEGEIYKDIYAVSETTGRVYYLYGYDVTGNTYYYLTNGLMTDVLIPELGSEIANEILFIPSTFGKTRTAVTVTVKVPATIDISTVSITTPDNTNPIISSYTEEGNYYVYTVNTNNWKGNYTVNVDYVENAENKTVSYNVEEYLGVYALLYSDGELRLNNTGKIDKTKLAAGNTVTLQSDDITSSTTIPWSSKVTSITTVTFENEVIPTYVASWFNGCTNLTEINNMQYLNTSNVTDMSYMFYNCSSLTAMDLSNCDITKVTNMRLMFTNCSSLKTLDASNLNASKLTNIRDFVSNCKNLETLNMEGFKTQNTVNLEQSFMNCAKLKELDLIGITKVNSMYQTFSGCNALQTIEIDTITGITHMEGTFSQCFALTNLDTSGMDVSKVISMLRTFYQCHALPYIDVSNWNTQNVQSMNTMFYDCNKLTNLDVSKWDTSNVTDMYCMFVGCHVLESIDVSGFNTAKVGNLFGMFSDCYKLKEIDAANWNVSNVTNMYAMFYNCTQLQTVKANNWSMANVTNMTLMFAGDSALTYLDMSSANFDNVTNYSEVLAGVVSEGTIVVADDTAKTWVTSQLPYTSKMVVKTVDEL